jgi:hypothetical protein
VRGEGNASPRLAITFHAAAAGDENHRRSARSAIVFFLAVTAIL